jgi:hypothetical protein
MPYRGSVPLFWRIKKSKYNMLGSRCATCGAVFFPPRSLCPSCRRKGKIEDFTFTGCGRILTHTIIRNAPDGFEYNTPYAVAIIALDEGANISGQIAGDITKIKSGAVVRPVFRKMCEDSESGLIHYGIKFEVI